jgi:TolB-like protein/Tfp pilus assembly protein PilF
MTTDIFLSYNREDAAVARVFADAFAREGMEVWWDQTLRSGETYDEVTEAALRSARAVVVLWSPRSVASHWVRAEATIAHRAKTLMPATIEPCNKPVMFELTQTADLSHWRGEADDHEWQVFLSDVRKVVGRSPPEPIEPNAASAAPSAANNGEPGAPFVAVLPVTHRAGDDEMEVLAEDLTEEVTQALARNRYFRVIAAGAMAAWRGKSVDYRAVGQKLKARYLVEGKVHRLGDDIRLTMQVIDAETTSMIWSERFVHEPDDTTISAEDFPILVASQLREQIVQTEMNRAMAKHGRWSAWEHVLRAISYKARMESETAQKDIEEVGRAIAIAPDFGLAHAVLASGLASRARIGGTELDEAGLREIQNHINQAMVLDGNNPDVLDHLSAAYMHLGDAESGLRFAQRAVQLDPYSALAQFTVGLAYFHLGHCAETIAVFSEADRILPLDNTGYGVGALSLLGICLFIEGRDEEAEAAMGRSLAFAPNYYVALRWKTIIAAALGRVQAARIAVNQLRRAEPGKTIEQYLRSPSALPFEHPRKDEAVAILRRLLEETEGEA